MEFNQFKVLLQKHITTMLLDVPNLFEVEVDKDVLWNTYLDSFPKGTNELFRERREFDCSACRHFVKMFGNVVIVKNNKVTTIWDFQTGDSTFQPVIDALSAFVKARPVTNVFVTKVADMGLDKNHEQTDDKILTWEHLYFKLPSNFVNRSSETEDTISGRLRDIRNVFKRSLDEISEESILTVLELIAQKSLYKGEEWAAVLNQFLKLHKEYRLLGDSEKINFSWEKCFTVGPVVGKIRNHSIGTLLMDITNGIDLDQAVGSFEAMVAPLNYKRPQAIFTKKMLDDAQKKLVELGLMDSLGRRYATLDDITVNNILFANRDASKRIAGSVFDEMAQGLAVNPKSFDRVEEISIENFVKDVLPTVTKVEALVENRHTTNMVSLIAPKVKGSKPLFKWNNGFSWAYSGNITDSMKERVKAAGGKVDGVLRFSIQWNEKGDNPNDFDAHCIEPNHNEISFRNKHGHPSSGDLDVDIIHPDKSQVAVENITWSDLRRMSEGTYKFFVNNYNHRGGRSGFTAEIEFNGQIFSFVYDRELRTGENVVVANVIYSRKDGFKLVETLPSTTSSRKAWGLDTNQFHPVSVCMFSPNYWDEQDGIGNRHYLFMLKNCINEESPNGFFNEFLREDLLSQKRVFEALGSKMRVEDVPDQLSGIGFSSTQRNSLIVKVEGQLSRTLKINF